MGRMKQNEFFQIASCISLGNEFDNLRKDQLVEGLYYVCGRFPWFYIRKLDSADNCDLRTMRSAQSTVVIPHPFLKTDISQIEDSFGKIQTFIYLRPFCNLPDIKKISDKSKISSMLKVFEKAEQTEGVLCRRLFKTIANEWWFIAEILTSQIKDLSNLLESLTQAGFDTLTKSVLTCHSDCKKFSCLETEYKQRMKGAESAPIPNAQFKCAMIMRNDSMFFLESDLNRQKDKLQRMESAPPTCKNTEIPYTFEKQLSYELCGPYVEAKQLQFPNQYVDRLTLRPIWNSWSFTFIFLRAVQEFSEDIPLQLANLIGVYPNHIVPRVYKITGEYDYLIPAYILNPAGLDELVIKFETISIEGNPKILTAKIPGMLERSNLSTLDDFQRKAALALFRNSGFSRTLWDEIKDLKLEWRKLSSSERLREWSKLSPRSRSVIKNPDISADMLDAFSRKTEDLGLGVTIAFSDEPIERAFIRLIPGSISQAVELESSVKRLIGMGTPQQHHVSFEYYKTEMREIIGILRYINRREIEYFLKKLDMYCERTEFHLIIGRIASLPNLDEEDICAPCVYPVDDNMKHLNKIGCAHCGRYLRPSGGKYPLKIRTNLRKTEPEIGKLEQRNRLQKVRVGLIDLSLTHDQLRAIGAIPKEKSKRKGIQINYSENADWRHKHEKFAVDIVTLIIDGALRDANLIVLPEYCVPFHAVKIILKELRNATFKEERLIVLGSHIDERGYNSSPIIFIQDGCMQTYLHQKQALAKMEKQDGLISRVGTADHLFQTDFGNFITHICLDSFKAYPKNVLDADGVLVPSFQPGGESLSDNLKGNPFLSSRLVVFANGAASSNPGDRPRTQSRIMIGETDIRPDENNKVTVGEFYGFPLVETVDLYQSDLDRARLERGAQPTGILPIHVDLWADAMKKKKKDVLNDILSNLKNLIADDNGSLENHLTLDWHDARQKWESIRSDVI